MVHMSRRREEKRRKVEGNEESRDGIERNRNERERQRAHEDENEDEGERERSGSCVSRACIPPRPLSSLEKGVGEGAGAAKLCEECAISEQSTRWSRGGEGRRGDGWGWYGSRKGSEYTEEGAQGVDGSWCGGAMPADGLSRSHSPASVPLSLSLSFSYSLSWCVGGNVEDSSGGCSVEENGKKGRWME